MALASAFGAQRLHGCRRWGVERPAAALVGCLTRFLLVFRCRSQGMAAEMHALTLACDYWYKQAPVKRALAPL